MNSLNLSQARPGQSLKLIKIDGDKSLQQRLSALGFRIGSQIQVLHRRRHGDVVIGQASNRLALGRDIAQKIWVEEMD